MSPSPKSQRLFAVAKVISLILIAGAVLLMGGVRYGFWQRPAKSPLTRELFPGIRYERSVWEKPRSAVVHVVTIDLKTPGLDFVVTPPDPESSREHIARTATQFMEEHGVQVAVNANFFDPFRANGPLDYYPHAGDPVDVFGRAMSDGNLYSDDHSDWAALCLAPGKATITTNALPTWTVNAVSGKPWLVDQGKVLVARLPEYPEPEIAPRTAAALNRAEDTLWLVAIDGRQGIYSEGATLYELADFLVKLGAWSAVNLDGGGSTTLLAEEDGEPVVLNAPFQTRIPNRERPVANHLGVRVKKGE